MSNNGNFPAYPLTSGRCDGISKRELFAAMAMQGYLANPNVDPDTAVKAYAQHSVTYADALLAELAKDSP